MYVIAPCRYRLSGITVVRESLIINRLSVPVSELARCFPTPLQCIGLFLHRMRIGSWGSREHEPVIYRGLSFANVNKRIKLSK